VATTAAVAYGAHGGTLIEAMVALCLVNAVVLVGYSQVVFRADRTPFLSGFYRSIRPMLTAALMALAVRYALDHYLAPHFHPVLQVAIGIALGGVIYAVLTLLTERPLLRKLLDMVRHPRASAVASLP
jgi:succinoglycan exporter